MAVGYRAILRLDDSEDVVQIAEEQLHSWLRSKVPPARNASLETADWEGLGDHHLGPKSMLRVVEVAEREDHARRRLYRLEEATPNGTFVVSIFALSAPAAHPGMRQTVVVEAEKLGVDDDSAIAGIGTPRLVRNILERTTVHDGLATLGGSPTIVHRDEVSDLVAIIRDPDRISSVVVGASLAREIDGRWAKLLRNLTSESVGVAAVYAVAADALDALNAALPSSHQVLSGRVRTFMPKVDLTSRDDGLRHRFLGPRYILENIRNNDSLAVSDRVRYLHAASTRRRFIELSLPADVKRGMDLLITEDFRFDRQLRTAAAAEAAIKPIEPIEPIELPSTGPEAEDEQPEFTPSDPDKGGTRDSVLLGRLRQLVMKFVGRPPERDPLEALELVVARSVAEAQVAVEQGEELLRNVASLEETNQGLKERLDDLELEAAILAEEADKAVRSVAFYRQKLVEAQQFDSLVTPEAEELWESPGSIEELLDRLTSASHPICDRVEFTGDIDAALLVQKRDPFGRYAASLWDYCRVLHDYAVAKENGYGGNVHTYLTDETAPSGWKCPPQRHASTESETTQNQWASERLFPVPVPVDSGGRVFMYAHFKPTHDSTFAPRMHYYDDTANTGRIYIGYFGRHLRNTKS